MKTKEEKATYMREWRAKNPHHSVYQKQYHKAYYSEEKNKEIAINRSKDYYADNREKVLKRESETFRYKRYGLTKEDFDQMLLEQGEVCAICEKPCVTTTSLSVDHNHHTGKIRGLLCRKCNSGIGLLGDDISLVEKALDYLKKYSE